jgi:hypothetical protein
MFPVPHPEVLATDWLAPVPFGRERDVAEVVRRLDPPAPSAPPPWVVAVAGPAGSGTSTVARRAAREVVERLRIAPGGASARLLRVRLAGLAGPHGIATALLRGFDPGFDGRGFPVAEILAGWLRRLRREAAPFVVVLDDAVVGGPELAPVLRALTGPDRFLPEGQSGLPPWWTIVAGTEEGLAGAARALERSVPLRPFVVLREYDPAALTGIVADRAERAMGRPAPPTLVDRLVARAIEDGGGSGRAIDLLRRELLARGRPYGPGFVPRGGEPAIRIEPWVVDAIGRASGGSGALLGEIRALEARLAREAGLPPLPTTTLWRRIVRLEQAGYLRREIRTGGTGGSRSVVRLLTPIDEWVTVPALPQSRRDAAPRSEAVAAALAAVERPAGWPSAPAG